MKTYSYPIKMSTLFSEVDHENANKIIGRLVDGIDGEPLDDAVASLLSVLQTLAKSGETSRMLVLGGVLQMVTNLQEKLENN